MTRDERIEKLLDQCAEDKNVVESPRGSNRGTRVNTMLRLTGLRPGFPWCAAAVTAWGVEALGSLWPVPRTADCDRILNWAISKGVLHKSSPKRGDIFLVMKSRTDAIHTGIVSSVVDDSTIMSWEGNTNKGGSREGYGVFYRERSRHNLWYVRWIDFLSDSADLKPASSPVLPWQVWIAPHGYFPVVEDKGSRPCVPIRPFVASALGVSLEATSDIIEWDEDGQKAIVAGKILTSTYLKGSSGWAPVREVAEALGCTISIPPPPKKVVSVGEPSEAIRQAFGLMRSEVKDNAD